MQIFFIETQRRSSKEYLELVQISRSKPLEFKIILDWQHHRATVDEPYEQRLQIIQITDGCSVQSILAQRPALERLLDCLP